MEMCGHHIKSSEILGIGPLMLAIASDSTRYHLYRECRYQFQIYLRNCAVYLNSDWFRPGNASDHEEKKQVALTEQYREEYHQAKLRILELIKETDETKSV